MERNYNMYNPEIIDSLIQVDNVIDRTKHEIKELKERKNAKLYDPETVKGINEDIQTKEADLVRCEQDRKDILRGYE